jgi:hypothetical protein
MELLEMSAAKNYQTYSEEKKMTEDDAAYVRARGLASGNHHTAADMAKLAQAQLTKPQTFTSSAHSSLDQVDEVYFKIRTLREKLFGPWPEEVAVPEPQAVPVGTVNELEDRLHRTRRQARESLENLDVIFTRLFG